MDSSFRTRTAACFFLLLSVVICRSACLAQYADLQIYSPGLDNQVIAAPNDYATEVLGNAWDMDSRSDLADYIPDADYGTGLTPYTEYGFNNGIFSFQIYSADNAYFHLLSPGQASTNPLGKNGQNLPIDSTKYLYLNIRMKTDQSSEMRVHWNTGLNYMSHFVRTVAIPTKIGWNNYVIDLESIAISARDNENRGWSQAGKITGLRIEPGYSGNIEIDWITLTGSTGGSTVDVNYNYTPDGLGAKYSMFLDTDLDPFNGYTQALVTEGQWTQSVQLNTSNLLPEAYRVIGFVSTDFATLNANPWDMNDSADVSLVWGLNNYSFSNGELSGTIASINGGGADPYVNMNMFGKTVSAYDYDTVAFELEVSQSGTAAVMWFNASGQLQGFKYFPVSPQQTNYTVDLSNDSSWYGTIGTIRVWLHNTVGAYVKLRDVQFTQYGQGFALPLPSIKSSPGTLNINKAPILRVLQPDVEGGEDFASAVLGNPWNMDGINDIISTANLQAANVYPNNYLNGKQGDFFCGVSIDGDQDPYQVSQRELRDQSLMIDADRYKNMTIEAFVDRDQDVTNGSVLRIIGWNMDRDDLPLNGDDTIIQTGGDGREWFSLTQDMSKLKLEPLLHPEGSYPNPPWSGLMNEFRVDVHEFSVATTYCINSIELRADDEANTQFALAYSIEDPDSNAVDVKVSFYYTSSETPINGSLIVSNLNMERDSRVYLWDTSGLPAGTYYVYAVATDGANSSTQMAHRIVIDHNRPQELTAPILELDSPEEGADFYKSLIVKGYALDNIQVALVEVLMDESLLGTIQPSLFNKAARSAYPSYADASQAGFNNSFDIQSFEYGEHAVEVRVYDTAGNKLSRTFSITRLAGEDPVISDPAPDDEPAVEVPADGGGGGGNRIALDCNLIPKKRKLDLSIANADKCSQIDIVGHYSKEQLQTDLSQTMLLKSINVESESLAFSAKRLKKLKNGKLIQEGSLYLGLVCDGELKRTQKIAVTTVKSRKKVRSWKKYLKLLKRKLK